ncbi:MAG TPA: hypothetical protein DDY49_14985 [Paenibacillaceae bacterium]|nr:hypothetical protein [Paenibacillaceae bacterium]
MTQREEQERQAIDRYYGEKMAFPMDEDIDLFMADMSQSLEKMKIADEDSMNLSLDEIIHEGLLRKEEKKRRKEMRNFILSSLIIILSLPLWMVVLGMKTILLWQWLLLIPVTLVILPFVKNGNRKEVGSHE